MPSVFNLVTFVNELLSSTEDATPEALEYSATVGDIAYTAAFNEVRRLLPLEDMMPYTLSTTTTGLIDGSHRVLRVTRTHGDYERECRLITQQEATQAVDPNSIYYIGTDEALSPAYILKGDDAGDVDEVTVFPNATGATVYYYLEVNKDLSASIAEVDDIPYAAYPAVAYKTAINILIKLAGDAAQDEEDDELLNIIQKQVQFLQGQYASELNNIGVKMKEGA